MIYSSKPLTEETQVPDGNIEAGLMYFLSLVLGGWWLWDRKRISDRGDKLEDRIRSVEQYSVGEDKVRQMIEDVVKPVKESQTEMKADVKIILKLLMDERRG